MQLAGNPTDSTSALMKINMATGSDLLSIWLLVAMGKDFILLHRSDCCVNSMCFSLVICILGLQDVEGRENV